MGNSQPQVQSPSAKRRMSQRRTTATHSGKLYIQSFLESPKETDSLKRSHSNSHSRPIFNDFDTSTSELKQNLPDDLKVYCNCIEMLYRFWCTEIEGLSQADYKEAAVLFYVNVFKRIPEARHLFTKNIELQAKQLFGMFRWIITNLRTPDPQRLVGRIRMLGAVHAKYAIKPEWYGVFLEALHETMDETVKEKYTSRTRFCMEQLYTVVANIMLNRDFESLSSAKIAKLLKSLNSLEKCLQDRQAKVYLELYMKEHFCLELMLFYQDCQRYNACSANELRQQIGSEMMAKYMQSMAECEINVSHIAKRRVRQQLKQNGGVFVEHLFDECLTECVELMRDNIWSSFRSSILRMAVDADIHYDEIQSSKSNLQLRIEQSSVSPNSDSTPTFG
mmetsp:Transcript_22051/g.35386  ORF Transcript_22051/g.35386 Transcript_22051/m.35386 type:complete len:391 (-) Transcript_22051:185-1357(-)